MKTILAIASTTHIDRHFERMAKSALDSGVEQIHDHYIRFLYNHDPSRELGVILAGKVLPMDDGEWALVIVAGFFETDSEKILYEYGKKNTVWQKYIAQIDEVEIPIKSQASKDKIAPEKAPQSLADLLKIHLDSTEIWIDGTVIKTKRLIASTGDLEIHVYPKDHDPPHFHIKSKQRGIDARYSLKTLKILNYKAGELSASDEKKIQNFFEQFPDVVQKLLSEHERLQS